MSFSAPQIAQASMIMQGGGAIASTADSFFGAATQKATLGGQAAVAEANARIFESNAHLAELSAQSALSQGQQQVAALTMKAGRTKSAQRAALAANGVDVGEGSAAEIQASTDILKEIDANTITANAVRTAWGYRTQGMNMLTQASNSRIDALSLGATAGAISPVGSAATSLLGSAGAVADSWYRYSKGAVDTRPDLDTFGKERGFW
ncbi:hypothetical protein [Castellaniella sp.]|uniref:virion core protein, T7 gp14 family n=1 Tax=Castellaniella sp. TaxID=1955812 RepID=UPI002AFFEC94|nr:hypothetical protein [Castellaniella sp.]